MPRPDDAAPTTEGRLLLFPDTAEARLRRALRGVDAALAEQRVAVAGFRRQMEALSGAVASLGNSAETLRDSLGRAAAETVSAGRASRELLASATALESIAQRAAGDPHAR